MINIVNLSGGLGNQLFQYFYGISLNYNNTNCKTKFLRGYTKKGQIGIESVFDISIDYITKKEILKNYNVILLNKYLTSIYVKLIKKKILFNKQFKIDYENQILKNNLSQYYHHGYWQSEEYFTYPDEIIKKLKFKKELNLNKILNISNDISTIAVHIRRADYLDESNKKIFTTLDDNYFLEEIKKMQKNFKKNIFIFFTDDYDWVKIKFINTNINKIFISEFNLNSSDEFQLMSQCDHFIISNSTFSWWAAYLSKNTSKKISFPRQWFIKNNFINKRIIPKNWK